jgi:hypothetical protein
MVVQTILGPSREYAPMAGRFKPVILPQSNRSGLVAVRSPGPVIRWANHHPGDCSALAAIRLRPAHDRNDVLHDVTAGAAGSTSQQISHRGADFRYARSINSPNG